MGRHRPDNCEAKVSIRTLAQGSMYQDAVRTNEVPGGEGSDIHKFKDLI